MSDLFRTQRRLTTALLLVMATQASLGLLFPRAYRDVEWIRAAWFGNDVVTLVIAAPLLFGALVLVERGSVGHADHVHDRCCARIAGQYLPRVRCILEAPREQESRAAPKRGSQ